MNKQVRIFLFTVMFSAGTFCFGQDSTKLYFTTGVGLIKSPGSLSKIFHPSVAFNSGLELTGSKNWFGQVTLDFNTLKYNQQVKTDGSPYLFQNTNSSLFMVGINGGKNFIFRNPDWFVSLYGGGGYLNLGEPRLNPGGENIITQSVVRKGSVFGRAGTRLAYNTKIKFLHTIYFDGSWWKSPADVQGANLNGLSFFVGTRMGMK
jgi:hypothetical protein